MIAVATNILVYAYRGDSPFYEVARNGVTELAEGRGAWKQSIGRVPLSGVGAVGK